MSLVICHLSLVIGCMNIRRTRQTLIGTGIAATAAAALVAAWGLGSPCDVHPSLPRRARLEAGDTIENADSEIAPLDEFAKLWDLPLRRPLVDGAGDATASSAAAASAAAASGALLNLSLVGTIVETGRSRAVFSTPNGGIELKGVGEIVGGLPGGPEIVEIEPRHVVVRFQGQLTTLRLKGADET